MAARVKKSAKKSKRTPPKKLPAKKSAPKKSARRAVLPSGKALYLYGISPSTGKPKAITAPGIDEGSAVQPLRVDSFVCWVAPVDANEFGAKLNSNMENLEWLSEAGVRHQHAVAEIAQKTAILPARFGTVFLSTQSLEEHIRTQKKALLAAMKRVQGADEWGVKVFREISHATAAVITAASGSDYLRKKATLMHAGESRGADEQIQQFAAELGKIARASAATGKVSGTQRDLMWQASFLLPRSKQKQWDAALQRWAKRWGDTRRIEATGPWPPYSFVSG